MLETVLVAEFFASLLLLVDTEDLSELEDEALESAIAEACCEALVTSLDFALCSAALSLELEAELADFAELAANAD
jgi:hypothetical protein